MAEQNSGFYENIPRGHGLYMVIYKQDSPSETSCRIFIRLNRIN